MAAFAFAAHVMTEPDKVPVAVPDTFRSPAHDALNDPFAEFEVCSVGFQLKSVHEEGDGIRLAAVEVQLPINAATVVAEGPVVTVLLSYPTQPAAVAAKHSNVARM